MKEEYAAQKKLAREIDKKVKATDSRAKSDEKRAKQKLIYHYAKLLKKNKENNENKEKES